MSEYKPSKSDLQVVGILESIAQEVMQGGMVALGVCSMRADGKPAFFYFDKTETDSLSMPIEKLTTMYNERRVFRGNAPENNRSHGTH